jgi:predicted TIM-barrel fold metal-dependent hydrolase
MMALYPIIDTHVHFWNMRNPDPGMAWVWLADDFDHPIIGDIDGMKHLTYDIRHVWAEARFAGVGGFVHVQAALGSSDVVQETRWLTRMRQDSPIPFTIIADADLGSSEALAQLDAHGESPYFVGVRDFKAEPMLANGEVDATYEATLQEMARRGLVFDLDCEWMNMAAARQLADRHPDLQIVLEHIGFPRSRDDEYFANWASAMEGLAGAPNVTCKISGLGMTDPMFTAESLRRWIDTPLEFFGPDRCVLGSNWPVDRLYSSYDAIMGIYRDRLAALFAEADQHKVLSDNAARIYRVLPD